MYFALAIRILFFEFLCCLIEQLIELVTAFVLIRNEIDFRDYRFDLGPDFGNEFFVNLWGSNFSLGLAGFLTEIVNCGYYFLYFLLSVFESI